MQNEPEGLISQRREVVHTRIYDYHYGRLTPREYGTDSGIHKGRGRDIIYGEVSGRNLPVDGDDLEPVLVLLPEEEREDNRQKIHHENDRLLG